MEKKRLQEYEPLWSQWYVDSLIGEGSFANVYKIKNETANETSYGALKVISIPKLQTDGRAVKTEPGNKQALNGYFSGVADEIEKEIKKIEKLKGIANILAYKEYSIFERKHDVGYDILLLMDYEKSLIEFATEEDISNEAIIKMARDISWGLMKSHQEGIIHKDIKLENIFVAKNGEYKISDFAIARKIESFQSAREKRGITVYTAPEVHSEYDYNEKTDIYALGVVLYLLLNDGNIPEALENRDIHTELPKPIRVNDKVGKIIDKALAYRPEDRYTTAEDFFYTLSEIRGDDFALPLDYIEASQKQEAVEEFDLGWADEDKQPNMPKELEELLEISVEAPKILEAEETAEAASENIVENVIEQTDNIIQQAEEQTEHIGTKVTEENLAEAGTENKLEPVSDDIEAAVEGDIIQENNIAESNTLEREEYNQEIDSYEMDAKEEEDIPQEEDIKPEEEMLEETYEPEAYEEETYEEEAYEEDEYELEDSVYDTEEYDNYAESTEEELQEEQAEDRDLKTGAIEADQIEEIEKEEIEEAISPQEEQEEQSAINTSILQQLEGEKPGESKVIVHAKAEEYGGFFDFSKESYDEKKEKKLAYDKSVEEDPFEVKIKKGKIKRRKRGRICFLLFLLIIAGLTAYIIFDEDANNKVRSIFEKIIETKDEVFASPVIATATPAAIKTATPVAVSTPAITPVVTTAPAIESTKAPVKDLTINKENKKLKELNNIKKLEAATELILTNNKLSDIALLQDSIYLKYLDLDKNNIEELSPLKKLEKLTSLNVGENRVVKIDALSNLTKLTELSLNDNKIQNIKPLGKLKKLSVLKLQNNDLSDISAIGNLKKLEFLDLSGNKKIRDILVLENLKELQYLAITDTGVNDNDVKALQKKLPNCLITK